MPQELEQVKNLDQAREYCRARGYYAGNRNLFSDRDLYVGILHEGEDFDRVEDAFYLYMEAGQWVTRVNREGDDPVISRYASFKEVWQAQYPDADGGESAAPAEEPQAAEPPPEPISEPEPESPAEAEAASGPDMEAELEQAVEVLPEVEVVEEEEPAVTPAEAEDSDAKSVVPEGFEPLFRTSPFLDLLGPFYNKLTGKDLVFGFYAEEKHCNSRGILHGGVISSLADVALGSNAVIARDEAKPLVTVNLTVDYAGAAQLGDWIEVHTDVQKVGGKMAFANCYFSVGTKRIARASAVFSVVDSQAASE